MADAQSAARAGIESAQSSPPLQEAVQSASPELLLNAAADSALSEDLALTLLKRSDLAAEVFDRLAKNSGVMQSRKLKLAIVKHLRAPRHISMPMVQHLFTFDLMQVALASVTPADIKIAAEEGLINRLQKLSSGEKLSLARRASGRVVGELLLHADARVIDTALENGRLTEASVIRALLRPDSSAILVEAVCRHARWSLRREVRVALLRNEKTLLSRAMEFARSFPIPMLRDILHGSHLPFAIKSQILKELANSNRRGLSI